MLRINCHSAYKHYDMFHSGGCGSGNYGSIFNTTYNINCGGSSSHGGFWSGLGLGFGNALAGLFGGIGMNGIGMGGWGMGGMMPWFASMGNTGISTSNSSTSGTSDTSGSNSGKIDKDNANIEKLNKNIEKLKGDKSDKDIKNAKNIYKELQARKEKLLDNYQKIQNENAYENLLNKLKAKYPECEKWGDDNDNDDATTPTTQTTPTAQGPAAPENTGVTQPQQVVQPADTRAEAAKKAVDGAATLEDLAKVNYDDLDDVGKKAYLDKAIALAKSDSTSPEALRNALAKLPDDVRVKVKESFYETGYTNVKKEELNAELLNKLSNVIDTSKIPDFHNVTLGTPKKDVNGKWKIPVKTYKDVANKTHYLNVPYIEVDENDGEIIFHGLKTTQKYVLQRDNTGNEKNLHLMQYKYHEGYGVGDVTRR